MASENSGSFCRIFAQEFSALWNLSVLMSCGYFVSSSHAHPRQTACACRYDAQTTEPILRINQSPIL